MALASRIVRFSSRLTLTGIHAPLGVAVSAAVVVASTRSVGDVVDSRAGVMEAAVRDDHPPVFVKPKQHPGRALTATETPQMAPYYLSARSSERASRLLPRPPYLVPWRGRTRSSRCLPARLSHPIHAGSFPDTQPAMSSKKSKLDLIVRQRYQNPIPPPAFPPLLVDIPVPLPLLIGKPDLVAEYAASLPLPMMIDSEIGMPLDLNAFDGMWTSDTRANTLLNPPRATKGAAAAAKQSPPAALDPEDAALLEPPARSTILNGVVTSANYVQAGSLKQTYHKPEVAWLRNTTYLSRDTGKKGGGGGGAAAAPGRGGDKKGAGQVVVDDSMVAQQQAIEKTFWYHDHTRVEELRHPLKPHLRAVDVSRASFVTCRVVPWACADAWAGV